MKSKRYYTRETTHDFLDNLIFEFMHGKSHPCFNCGEMTRFYEDIGVANPTCSVECTKEFGGNL